MNGSGNNNQAFPAVIAAAVDSSTSQLDPFAGTTQIKADFTGAPNTTYQLDFYDNGATADPSGFGQGKIYLGTTTITTDASGDPTPGSSTFFSVLQATGPVGDVLSITATDALGNTSQFSNDINTILRPQFTLTGLSTSVRGQLAPYTLMPTATSTDLAGGLTYAINWGDGNQETDSSSLASFVARHIFTLSQPPNTPYQVQVAIQDQYGFTGLTQTLNTQVNVFALENNNTEIDVGARLGGSTFVLTGDLNLNNTPSDTFNLDLDGGSANSANGGLTINFADFSPAILASLTKVALWGQATNPSDPLSSNYFDASTYTGTVDIHNGPGRNTFVGSQTGVNNFQYDAHATDSLLIIAPATATNNLSFAGADQAVTFDLGMLSGQPQQVTATGDMLAIVGSLPVTGQTPAAAALNAYTTSNFNDSLKIPSGFAASRPFSVTGGAGNDTFTITNPTTVGSNDTFTIDNTSFVSGTGNDTFTISGGTSVNDTFTINNSSLAGNDTFTIGGGGTVNDTFTIGGSALSGNDTFTIGSGNAVNDTFTIDAASTLTNDTFTIGGSTAGTVNDTFTINNNGLMAGNDTFTINNSNSTANDTFTINNGASFAPGVNDTFTISDLGTSNDTFTINGGLDSSVGSNDTFVITSAGAGQDTFTINGGVNTVDGGNDTFTIGGNSIANDTFTINGGIATGGNDTFTIGANAGTNDTFTINGGISTTGGNDTFTIGSGANSQDTFTIGSITTAGSNDTFTMGSGTSANDTFTIGNVNAGGAGVNDTFTIEGGIGSNDTFTIGSNGGIAVGGSNDTFTINDTGASNDTFTINGGLSVIGNDTFIMQGLGAGQDTFIINGAVTATGGNDTFTIGGGVSTQDTFTITGGISTTGGGLDTFTIGSSDSTQDTFTIGSITNDGTNDTFTIGSGIGSLDTFTIGSITDSGAGVNDTFIILGGAGTNDTFTIGNGSGMAIDAGGVNDTFTINDQGASNDTFTINGGVSFGSAAAADRDKFALASTGTGQDTFTITGGVAASGAGNDTFIIQAGSGTSDTFTITGGVTATGTGNDTFVMNNTGAATGNDIFVINSNFTAGTGNDTFIIQDTATGASNDTFTINGNINTGAGNDTFIIDSGAGTGTSTGNDTFTINGAVTAAGSGQDTFTITNQTITNGAVSGSSAGNDTFVITGGVQATGNDTFTVESAGSANDTFVIGGSVSTNAAGQETFVITSGITAGAGNDTFTIGSTGIGNDTFVIGGINAEGSGNDTFTIGSTGVGNDTFTIGSGSPGTAGIIEGSGNDTFVMTQSGGANDTFTIQGGVVATGAGNDTFVINNAGAAAGVNDTFTINGNLTGGAGNNQFFVQDTSTTASNDTFIINSSLTAPTGSNDSFLITNIGVGNDTFTINGVITGGGTGADSFELINSGPGNDTFTITGGLHDAGTGGDTFLLSNTGNGNDSFTVTGGTVFGSGEDLFSINTLGNGNNNITINGNVVLGSAADTFFVISQAGDGNNTIKIAGSVTAGNGSDFMTLGTSGAGTDVITITGPVSYGNGADSFQLNGSGTGNATFNLLGGVSGQGFDTYTIEDPGAVSGAELMTVNGNFGGGAGSDTFILTGGLNNHNGNDTFALNGNLIGGAGSNTFSVTDSGLATNSFTLNGVLQGGSNDQGDVFELAGLYQTVHLASGSSTSIGTGDTYEFSGAVHGTFLIKDPDQDNRTDTLDLSKLNSGVTVNLGSTAAQTVAPGLTLQLSDANGFSNVIGTTFSDTIYGNARTNLLQGADALDSSYQSTAPGVGANGKLQVVLLDFDTAFSQANGVFNFNTFYATAGVTPMHFYTPAERQAILLAIETDYAPFLSQFNSAGQLTQAGIYFTTNPNDPFLVAAGTNHITEYFDQSVPAGGDEPTSPTGAAASSQFEPGGTSSDLDFRDADMTGTASIQVNGILGEPLQPASTETNWITLSTKIAAHELGHLLGLHHADSFGPIGDGIMPLPGGSNYNPGYTGPIDANETFDHIITSGDSVGADRWNDLRDVFFGEREDVMLAFSFAAPTTPSNPVTVTAANPSLFVAQQRTPTKPISQTNAQSLYLAPISVPNTEAYGRDAGKTFEAQAVDVQGSIGLVNGLAEQDYYSFTGNAGDVMNVNVMSQGITRIDNLGTSGYIDPVVFLFKVNSNGTLTQVAYNDDVFSASADGDASLVDVTLPSAGGYVIKVTSFSFAGEGALDGVTTPTQAEIQAAAAQISDPTQRATFLQNTEDAVNGTDTGNYELFVYRFKAGVTASGADTLVPGTGPATIVGGAANGDVLQNAHGASFTAPVGYPGTFAVATITGLSGTGNYSANINWGDGSSSSGTISTNGNQVTILGSHPYAATGTYNLSIAVTEDAVTVDVTGQATVVSSVATTTTVTSSTQNNTSTYGQSVTFNATVVTNPVGSGTPTGSVDFVDATTGQDLGTFTLRNGSASVVVSSLAAEGHSIQAHYIADTGFDLTSSGMLTQTVNPATLLVTANSASRVFGQGNPVLAATITGFVNNDPSTVVSGVASLTTTAMTTSPVGVYPIVVTQGTLNAANYNFTFVNGTLTVGKDASSTATGGFP